MAKLRKFKLSWKPSDSDQIAGYKLYWSKESSVSYDSEAIELGNVSEVFLPDVFKQVAGFCGAIALGITAVDIQGNESDITILAETYRAAAPPAPVDFSLKVLDDFRVMETTGDASEPFKLSSEKDTQQDEWEELARIAEPLIRSGPTKGTAKYYDDVGFRKPI